MLAVSLTVHFAVTEITLTVFASPVLHIRNAAMSRNAAFGDAVAAVIAAFADVMTAGSQMYLLSCVLTAAGADII